MSWDIDVPERMKEILMEFVETSVTGLVAVYDEGTITNEDGTKRRKKTTMPIVGYLKDGKDDHVAAVIGDGGIVVPAVRVKGFCGVEWQHSSSMTTKVKSEGRGGSLFEAVFGGKW